MFRRHRKWPDAALDPDGKSNPPALRGADVAAATIEAKALMRADMAALYVNTASDWRAK